MARSGRAPTRADRAELISYCVLALLYAGLLSYFVHNPFCNMAFRCGCRGPLNGGWALCNVHNPEPPHCPWCSATSPAVILVSPPTVVFISVLTAVLLRLVLSRCATASSPSSTATASYLLPYLLDETAPAPAPESDSELDCNDPTTTPREGGLGACFSVRNLLSLAIGVPLGFFGYNLVMASLFFLASPDYPFFFWYTRP